MNINDIKKECEEVAELLLRDDMSHTDLANWFLGFCTRIGAIAEEIESVDVTDKVTRVVNKSEAEVAHQVECKKAELGLPHALPDGYVVGFGSEKGNMCKICNRVFVNGEIYADKGTDSLCQVHAYQKGIIKMNSFQYEKIKKEYGL